MKKQLFLFPLLFCGILSVSQNNKLPLTLESIWTGYFDQKDIHPHILNKKPSVAFIRADKQTNFEGILSLDMVTGKIIDTLFTNQTKVSQGETPTTFAFFEDFEFSPDDKKILIKTEKQIIYHSSFKEFTFLWDNEKRNLKPVSTDGKISFAEFNATSKYLAYVRDANLYIKDTESDKVITITNDGNSGSIINGMADEVYEDGFGLNKMYQWNNEGTKIAFIKINQGFVRKYPIISYEKNEPTVTQNVYAKAGEAISDASIYIYDVKGNFFTKLDLGGNPNQYILNFKWQPNDASIFVERLNRQQKKLDVIQCNATNGNIIKTVLTEEKPNYVKFNNNNLIMNPKKNSFFWMSEKNNYNHIYEVSYDQPLQTQITKGNWEVKSIEGFDPTSQKLFFMANENNIMQNHLYSIGLNGKDMNKVTNAKGWHTTWLSKDYKYYFDKATTLNTPAIFKILKTNGKEITNKAIIENKLFKENIKNYDLNDLKPFSFSNSKGNEINGWLVNGKNENKKPLLLYIYGGNNKQEVTEEWNERMTMTFKYFASKGYTVACIDPVGTPGKGEKFRKLTYNNLVDPVIEDIIKAKNYLISNYNVDPKNTALMGWSYGGFLTTMMATKYAGNFNKYIAIAPVTSWREYNAPFTERILQMPSDNPEKYKEFKPDEYIDKYKNGLLLIHGSADDNVHVEHTMKLAKALTEKDAYYDLQIFTDRGHSLSDGTPDRTRINLFKKILAFLNRQE